MNHIPWLWGNCAGLPQRPLPFLAKYVNYSTADWLLADDLRFYDWTFVHRTTGLSFRNPFHGNWNPSIPSNGHSFSFFIFLSLPVQTALCCQHLYLILHSTVNVTVDARGKQAQGMNLLIGLAWSIHTSREPLHPIQSQSVVWYHVTQNKQTNSSQRESKLLVAPVGGLIYSVMEAANCDMTLLRTVITQMQ